MTEFTFEQFIASRRREEDLLDHVQDLSCEDMPGYAYADNLYIEDAGEGVFRLLLDRCYYESRDVRTLEARLYAYAVANGLLDAPEGAEVPAYFREIAETARLAGVVVESTGDDEWPFSWRGPTGALWRYTSQTEAQLDALDVTFGSEARQAPAAGEPDFLAFVRDRLAAPAAADHPQDDEPEGMTP